MTAMVDLSALGQKIKSERKRQGLTLEALSERIGISRNFLWEIEDGRKAPAIQTLYQLGVCLNLSVDYLLGISQEKKLLHPDTPSTRREMALGHIMRTLDACGERELALISDVIEDLSDYLRQK